MSAAERLRRAAGVLRTVDAYQGGKSAELPPEITGDQWDATAEIPGGIRQALAVLLETEARVDTEDRAALANEGRSAEAEHNSCTTASCTTMAALALADAILGVPSAAAEASDDD